jgi:hypothetical protein
MSHRPVCVKCETEFRPERNGFKVVDMFQHDTKPYQIWDADMWKCPKCGIEIAVGFGWTPLFAHFENEFDNHFNLILNKPHCFNKEGG